MWPHKAHHDDGVLLEHLKTTDNGSPRREIPTPITTVPHPMEPTYPVDEPVFSEGYSRSWGTDIFRWQPFRNWIAPNPTKNLRYYTTAAILPPMKLPKEAPPMPLDGHRSHLNYLSVRPEPWRRLLAMKTWAIDDLLLATNHCKIQVTSYVAGNPLRFYQICGSHRTLICSCTNRTRIPGNF